MIQGCKRTIDIPIGSDCNINLLWTSDNIVGEPIQLYGYNFTASFVFDSDVNNKLIEIPPDDIITIPDKGIIKIKIPKDVTSTLSCYDSGLYTIGYIFKDNYNTLINGRWSAQLQIYNRIDNTEPEPDEPCGCVVDFGI